MAPKKRELWSEIGSLLWFGLGIFTVVALVTYHSTDPSMFNQSGVDPQNACGRVGAQVAALLIQGFGIAAYLVPALFVFLGMALYKNEGVVHWFSTLGGMAVSVMSLTVFVTLQSKYWMIGGERVLTGGYFGFWLQDFLVHQLNRVGASLVSFLVFAVSMTLSTPVRVLKMIGTLVTKISKTLWAASKMLVRLLAYFGGILLMRIAHHLGVLLKSLSEAKMRPIEGLDDPVTNMDASSDAPTEDAEQDQEVVAMVPPPPPPAVIELQPSDIKHETKSTVSDADFEIITAAKEEAKNAAQKAAERLSRFSKSRRGNWKLPALEFIKKPPRVEAEIDKERLRENSQKLKQKFLDFDIEGEITAVRPGPVITLYEFRPGPGVKVSKIAALVDDLSMALSAKSVRILAPLPGKAVVGIEIPSDQRETVYLREFLQHPEFNSPKSYIPLVMGKDIAGQPVLSDLAKMPHLLCAGQTGSGKSVFMNGLIISLLYRFTPDELRLILVDPKFIEFRAYQDIPHLLLPVVDDPKHAATALKWAVREMERRYRILAMMGVKNLAGFNQKVDEMGVDVVRDLLLGEENQAEGMSQLSGGDWLEAFEPDENGAPKISKLPYIVVIIDELADLMMVAKKEVEISIARIAQKARASGIHLVIATQRPSTDVITGLIKANLPSRVSFQLASYVDSKTILDRAGAERLLGQGDMLFIPPGTSQLTRLHGALVDDSEIEKITSFLKAQGKPVYRDEILVDEDETNEQDEDSEQDELFDQAIELIKRSGHASASFLQRHLKVGYNRAARMIETMEARGMVGPAEGAKPREVLIR